MKLCTVVMCEIVRRCDLRCRKLCTVVISSVNHDSNYDSGLGARVAVIVKHNVYLGRQVIRTGILIEFQFWLTLAPPRARQFGPGNLHHAHVHIHMHICPCASASASVHVHLHLHLSMCISICICPYASPSATA